MLSTKRYHFKAAALPLALAIFLGIGSLYSCSENPPTQGKDSCDTCQVPCDTCDTTKSSPNDTTSHNFVWTEYSIPSESSLTGVLVFNDTTIFAIGTYLYRFNGTNWKRVNVRQTGTGRELAFPDFTMFAFSPTDFWIVQGDILDHYIGNELADEYRPKIPSEFGGAVACWGTSSTNMFFVSVKGYISHFDGQKFTKMTSPTAKDLRSVWGTSHNDVWASGANLSTGETTLLHFDGTSWKEDELALTGSAQTSGLSATWSCDSAGHKFVVASGAHVYRKTDNGPWRNDSTLVPNDLGGGAFVGIYLLSGNNANDFVGAGSWGWVGHWNGKSWKRYDELYNYSILNYTSGCLSMKGNTICVVGLKSGSSWIAVGRRK